jgi:hypothetical protein
MKVSAREKIGNPIIPVDSEIITFTIDTEPPTADVQYSPSSITNQDVVATLTGWSETLTGITPASITFTGNGT